MFEKLSDQYTNVKFIKIDVDECKEIAQKHAVRSMPTFQFFKDMKKIGEFSGANPSKLEALIKQHSSVVEKASVPQKSFIPSGYIDLEEYVQKTQIEILNGKQGSAIIGAQSEGVESDCDEQLIFVIPFNQPVKVHSLKFDVDGFSKAPKLVKIFSNRSHLSFEEASTSEPTQALELTEKDFEEDAATALRFVKFQSVNTIAIFIENNQEDEDETFVKRLTIVGSPLEKTRDVSEMKKDPNEQ